MDPEIQEPLPSAARIAAGRCPGFATRYHHGKEIEVYRIDISEVRVCPNKLVPPADLCGIHANQRALHRSRRATEAAARAAYKEHEQQQVHASNLAMMLADESVRVNAGTQIGFFAENGTVRLDRQEAGALLDLLKRCIRRDL